MRKIFYLIFFVIILAIPVILPYFHSGYFPTHDGEWAVVRLGDMFRTLRDFQIPARYSGNLNFGYGYPLFNFTYPLPYYLGVIFHFLGFGFVGTIKIFFAGSVLLSAFFMFLASKILWKNSWAGIASAALYAYFPYRMVDLYVRGSIGESMSFILFPLLFYLAIKLINKQSFVLVASVGVCVASLVMTHNIMTVLFMPLYIIFICTQAFYKNKETIKALIISIFLGFGLSAFFWIPAILEKGNILLSKIPIADRNLYFVTPKQFIFPSWGYGAPTDVNGFSYQLGMVHLVIFIVIILFLLSLLIKNKYNLKDESTKIACLLVVITLFYIFLLFKPSELLWKYTPLLSEINYPWISLGVVGFLVSLSAGFLSRQYVGRCLVIVLAVAAVFAVLPYAKPQYYINKGDNYYLTNDATTTSSNELMPLWVKKIPSKRLTDKVEISEGIGSVKNVFASSRQINFSVDTLTKIGVRINTIYYPGWKIFVDAINTDFSFDNEQGVMEINLAPGRHNVSARFQETPLRFISDVISLLSVVLLLYFVVKRGKHALS
jgi:hypothetical protein